MSNEMTTFQMVSRMNEAFGNPKGDPLNIDWERVRRQFKNVGHEFVELMTALGGNPAILHDITMAVDALNFHGEPDLGKVRDASRDIVVFADGGHHFMGIDGDRDMKSVIDGVMSRFIKDEADLNATLAKHRAKGVTEVYVEGEYPTAILKSEADQPDAPKGKFLKSASYKEPVFYDIHGWERTAYDHVWLCNATGKYHWNDEAEQMDTVGHATAEDAQDCLRHYCATMLAPADNNLPPSLIVSPEAQKKLAEAGADISLINGTAGDQAQ